MDWDMQSHLWPLDPTVGEFLPASTFKQFLAHLFFLFDLYNESFPPIFSSIFFFFPLELSLSVSPTACR